MKFIFQDKQKFHTYQEAYKQIARQKQLTAKDHILYNLLRAKDLKHGFSPFKNERKIDPYYKDAWQGYTRAMSDLKWIAQQRASNSKSSFVQAFCNRYGDAIPDDMWSAIKIGLEVSK